MASVSLHHLVKEFDDVRATNDVSLEIDDGDFVTLVGPSGCGKTTILRMIAGLSEPTSGTIRIGGKDVTRLDPQRRGIAMVFQDYALFPHMNVWKNVAFGLEIQKYPKHEIAARVDEALAMVQMESLKDRSPAALSGGQRQRVAVARALALQPQVYLMDEPLSNLDAKLRLQMRTELKRIHKRVKATMIYVTHDQIEAMTLSTKVVILNRGVIQQVGSPDEVYHHPQNKFVGGFIGSPPMNFVETTVVQDDGKLVLDMTDFRIEFNAEMQQKIPEKAVGKPVILGLRPENIFEKNELEHGLANRRLGQNPNLSNPISVTVDIVEPIGSDKFLDLFAGERRFLAQVNGDCQVNPDDQIEVVIDLAKIHLFDKETEDAYF
ncbi:MAG: ABC transporter ATP-binding protein [Gemmatimonadetes bacterium]|nr:MAG: ABC transporter ATP-binding protein [Gemmatimonadota bacterium]